MADDDPSLPSTGSGVGLLALTELLALAEASPMTARTRLAVTTEAAVLAVLAVLASALLLSAPADAAPRTCFWAVPDDPNAVNVAYPDTGASYWGGTAPIPPGGAVELTGEYPHARYFSFNAYDPAARPVDALADFEIDPDDGSSNPFLPSADRTVGDRDYTVRIVAGTRPDDGGDPNTLYLGAGGTGTSAGIVIYRIYVVDDGRDATGDVGLPQAALVLPDGTRQPLTDACSAADVGAPAALHDAITATEGVAVDAATMPSATDPVTWEKFFNLLHAQSQRLDNTPLEPLQTAVPGEDTGGYLSNVHNAYVFTTTDRGNGPVLVLQGRAPSFPETRDGAAVMPEGADVRYWSLCQNENASTRYFDCVYDEDVLLDGDGRYTIVISTPGNRPTNATTSCGVNWLPWGPTQQGLPIMRHMLPSLDYAQSIQRAGEDPAATMGDILPTGTYATVADFEGRGCPDQTIAGQDAPDPAADSAPTDRAPSTSDADSLPATGGGAGFAALALAAAASLRSRRRSPAD